MRDTFNLIDPARPPQIMRAPVVLAVAGVVFGAGATAGQIAIVAFGLRLATSVVLSYASQALSKKPSQSNTQSAGLLTNAREAAASHEYVYGEVRKGGTITYLETTGTANKFLHMIIALAGHELDSIGNIYINDEVVALNGAGVVASGSFANKIRIKKHLGTATQTVDPDLLAESGQIGSSFRGQGIAYLYVRLDYDNDVFANGTPLFTAMVRGKKVYDPRTDTTAYSANAALCARDYLLAEYGLGDTVSNDTVFSASANVCDEVVDLDGGGTEPRYEMNGVIRADQSVGKVLQLMLTCCAGSLFWGQGEWQLRVGYYSPAVKTFTLDDLRSSIAIETRVNIRDNFNGVAGTFNDAAQDYITADYPAITSAAFLAEDHGDASNLDMELPFTTSAAAAQRLAKLALFRAREQITLNADFGLEAFAVQVGDIVALSIDRYGWAAKEFEVVAWTFFINGRGGDLRVNMSLRETSEAAYDWNAEERALISNNTTLLKFDETAAVGLTVTSETLILKEKITNLFNVLVTSSLPDQVDAVEVQFKPSGAADYTSIGTGALGPFRVIDVKDGDYDFRARSTNGLGYSGDWEYLSNIAAAANNTPPADVTGFSAEVNGATTYLEWEAVADLDLSYYRIRHAVETAGATWANATTAIDKVPRPATSAPLAARPGTYLIRAYDKTGFASVNYATAVVAANDLEPFATSLTQAEHTTFSGTKTDCSVASLTLQITDPASAPTSAQYDFSAYIDTGAARLVQARIDVAVARLDSSAGNFDDLGGGFDSLPGNFDDLTGSAQFADCNVVTYVSVTPDDPSASPTWSPYKRLRAAALYGRAFRFRAVLHSTSDNVTPGISALTALVEYT